MPHVRELFRVVMPQTMEFVEEVFKRRDTFNFYKESAEVYLNLRDLSDKMDPRHIQIIENSKEALSEGLNHIIRKAAKLDHEKLFTTVKNAFEKDKESFGFQVLDRLEAQGKVKSGIVLQLINITESLNKSQRAELSATIISTFLESPIKVIDKEKW